MAVENKYVDSSKHIEARFASGARKFQKVTTFEVAAADDDGSIYRVATIPSNACITNILIRNDAVTGGTDYDVGVYKTTTSGAVVDADYFGDGLDLSSGHASGSELSGISALPVEDSSKRLYEMLGVTLANSEDVYDIALTANTVGTAAGTVVTIIEYLA